MSGRNSESILALLAGAAIGVGLGILFAPDKGSKTRVKIKTGFDDLKDEAKEKFSGSKEELKEAVDNLLSKSSYKAEEAITFLEEKLAELKKQNAKLQK
ncbi:YtxH domain-containing protein [Flavobacterium solisilvae]|uniref:YtxH domain-containing protein n=1 Tax=Flavobacterium solisilvae TaxID=1852019 RepID=A0ABX1QU71_9FLAO|nr:YtxH domain-containing protein [Flavobacterium solisilvae]NMH25820.1 YtxH domain-containing protein [Flavobacterium solisilvae]